MHVLLFQPRFWQPIVTGEKLHTIRPTRKRVICPGDQLSLRGWSGAAYRSPQRVLTDETCIDCRPIWIDNQGIHVDGFGRVEDLDAFARSDGFTSWEEMQAFWNSQPPSRSGLEYGLPFSGDFIRWGVHPLFANS